MAEVKTVRIHLPHASGEWATINASDFDPAVHVIYGAEPLETALRSIDDVSRETPPIVVWDPTLTKFTETPAPRKRGRPRKDA